MVVAYRTLSARLGTCFSSFPPSLPPSLLSLAVIFPECAIVGEDGV